MRTFMKKNLLCLALCSSITVFSDLSQKDKDRVLFQAINLRGPEAVKEVLANSADVNAINEYGQTALHWAADKGFTDIVQLLLENGANANAVGFCHQTPLHDAARRGYIDIARLLLENNANIDAVDNCENTPLAWAEKDSQIETMQFLLDHGTNIDVVNTVLGEAARNNHIEAVKLLLANGADVNAQSKYGHTALHHAARSEKRIAIAQLLLANGADANIPNKYGDTALYNAIENSIKESSSSPQVLRSVKMVELLLDHGVDVDAIISEKTKLTPLLFAVKERQKEIVKLLLKRGANRKAVDINGRTALYWAKYDPEIARLL